MQDSVVGKVVQPVPEVAHVLGNAVVCGGQLSQHLGHVIGVGLGHVHPTEPVHGAQDPQIRDIVVAAGEIEQAEPVAY